MSEQRMPELSDERICEAVIFEQEEPLSDLTPYRAVAKAQRELLEGYRKVPSVEEIARAIYLYRRDFDYWEKEKQEVRDDFLALAEWVHRWLMEER